MTDKHPSRLTKLLLTVAIVCIISGLAPRHRAYVGHESDEVIIEWSLGVNSSPFWKYREEQSADGSFRFESKLHYFSWSSALLVVGVIALKGWMQRRKKLKKADN